MRRVLLMTRDLPPARSGGVASWVDDVARALVDDGREVTVLVEQRGLQADPGRPYRVVGVPGRSWHQWQGVWMGALALPRVDSETVVLGASWRLVSGLLRVRRGGVVLAGAHGSDLTRIGRDASRFRRVAQRTHLLAVSNFLAEHARALGAPPERIHTAPWPLSRADVGTRGDALMVLSRLVPGKGLRDALLLAHRLERPVVVIGDGPTRAAGEAFAREHGIAVEWRGALPRAQAREALQQAAALLLLSEPGSMEGLGVTALEAAAVGVPTIGRDVGGIREAVGPGFLLSRAARVEHLELESVQAFLADPDAGHRARRHVQSAHGPQAFVHAFDAVVESAARR